MWLHLRPVELIQNILLVVAGLVALFYGAEWLVKGASDIAIKVGISPLVVGLTVVAFGTSAPELLVCLEANANGRPDVALGNIIGSNICNIALILGVAALIKPVQVHRQIIKKEMPILLLVSVVFLLMLFDGEVSVLEGAILFVSVLVYVVVSICQSRKESNQDDYGEFDPEEVKKLQKSGLGHLLLSVLFVFIGLVVLKFGSQWLVNGGGFLAKELGVSDAIIALLLFAFGTSLPELATSIVAVRRGEGDIITGNAIGSCIFNVLAVIGLTALVNPIAEGNIESVDKWVMLGVTVGVFIFMGSRMRLGRIEGLCLVLVYAAYCVLRALMDQSLLNW